MCTHHCFLLLLQDTPFKKLKTVFSNSPLKFRFFHCRCGRMSTIACAWSHSGLSLIIVFAAGRMSKILISTFDL